MSAVMANLDAVKPPSFIIRGFVFPDILKWCWLATGIDIVEFILSNNPFWRYM